MIAILPILLKLEIKSDPRAADSPMQKMKFFDIMYLFYYIYINLHDIYFPGRIAPLLVEKFCLFVR